MIGEDWGELIDFASAERVSEGRNQESDIIWKFRRRDTGHWIYAFVLLALPSHTDRYLPVGLMTFQNSPYEGLIGQGLLAVEPDAKGLGEKESLVAALFRLEPSWSGKAARVGVARLKEYGGLEETGLSRAFLGWLNEVILTRLGMTADEFPRTLEEFESMLAERIDSWNKRLREESWQEGWQKGLQQGEARALLRLLEKHFGPVDPGTRDRIAAADADLLLEWIDRSLTAESLADVFHG
jgi:hypothetical protein